MAGLKTLVIVMGLAIIIGVTVVVVTIVQRAGAPAGPVGAKNIDLPAGARVVGQDLSQGRILLRLRLADGGERLLIVDAASGEVSAVFNLRAKGAAR